MSVCLSDRISPEPHAWSLLNFLCVLPMSMARSSSGTLTIGGDGSAQRGQNVIYDCLVYYCFHCMSIPGCVLVLDNNHGKNCERRASKQSFNDISPKANAATTKTKARSCKIRNCKGQCHGLKIKLQTWSHQAEKYSNYYILLHFAWVVDDAKCIVYMRVCVSVCLSMATCPHYCTDPDVNFREW